MRSLFLIILAGISLAQNPIAIRNTFTLSQNVAGVPLQQRDARLFYNENQEFMVVWEDERSGEIGHYYRRISPSGAFVSEVTPTFGNAFVVYTGSNSFISGNASWYSSPFNLDYVLNARAYSDDLPVWGQRRVNYFTYDDRDFGWLGFSYTEISAGDSVYLFSSRSGRVQRQIYNKTLSEMYDSSFTGIYNSISGTLSKTIDNRIAFFWVNYEWLPGYPEWYSIYGRFYNTNGTIQTDSVLIYKGIGQFAMGQSENHFPIFAMPLPQNKHLISFVTDKYLYTFRITHGSAATVSRDSIPLPESGNSNAVKLQMAGITNIQNSKKDLVIRRFNAQSGEYIYSVAQIDVTTGAVQLASTTSQSRFDFGRKLFKVADQSYYYPEIAWDDVYITKIHGFVITEQKLVSDEPLLSNERNSFLVPVSDGRYISGYSTELGYYARFISPDDSAHDSPQYAVPGPLLELNSGQFAAVSSHTTASGMVHVIHTLSGQLQEIKKDTIRSVDGGVMYSDDLMQIEGVSDSIKMYIVHRGDSVYVGLLNQLHQVIKEKTMPAIESGIYNYDLDKESENSFLARLNSIGYFINSQLDFVEGPQHYVEGTYLGRDRIGYFDVRGGPWNYDMHLILSYIRTGEQKEFKVGRSFEKFTLDRVNDSYFLVSMLNAENAVYCRPYNMNGNPVGEWAALATVEGNVPELLLESNENKLLLTWSQTTGASLDVMGKSFTYLVQADASETGKLAPESFSLKQNYPNPFNPETKISYSLAQSGMVELKVYDALGRLAGVIESGEKPAGTHTVTFDGSKLASGIYFCEMKAGAYRSVVKMILLR
ncbi:MAG: hypothetical protein FMNOHCHN_03944 [Ignavibacteriaceae bacterium]|nr:hypothetical protein [Ignavibacteriaceae bacterium]